MASIIPTTGLISGLKTDEIINALVVAQNNIVTRLQDRQKGFQSVQLGLTTLSAKVLTLSTSAASLGSAANYAKFKSTVSDNTQLSVTTNEKAVPGDYTFQTLRLASAQQVMSRGFADSTEQTVGAGTLTIASGGRVATETALDGLNGGTGIRRGTIKITDRAGDTADVDLSSAATITDVLDAINNSGLAIKAEAQGDKLVVTDTSGQTASNLIIADKSGGHTAQDLGIKQSVASSTLTGSSIYQLTGSFSLGKLNDGNGLRLAADNPDLRITLSDVAGTNLDVDLNGATTLGEVVNRINSNASNGGKLTATISNNRLVLTDNTGGGGSSPLSASSLNGSNAASVLGLTNNASGNVLSGNRLIAGLNSVLISNLRGGQGIDTLGSLSLTDRTGTTATVDLSGAESVDDVLAAINAATSSGGTKLQLSATLNSSGNGITVRDTSESTAGNLVIADVGGSTLAAQLGIAADVSQSEVQSTNLGLRYVNEATSLSKYAPGAVDVRRGTFAIKDSTGIEHFINVSTSHKTIGDVIDQVNNNSNGKVTAKLNDTGDGIVLIDQAGGTGQLEVRDLDSQTAADLRLLGTGTAGTDGKSRISGRSAATITLSATDTLQTLADKINAAKSGLSASIIDDGTSFSPKRLVLTSKTTGSSGRVLIDDGGLGLSLTDRAKGQDALLRVGVDAASGFVVANSTNVFDSVVSGLTVTAKAIGTAPTTVTVTRDTDKLTDILNTFVKGYNDVVQQIADSTKFDSTRNQRGVLQGEGIALRVSNSLASLANGIGYGSAGSSLRSLRDLGITVGSDGKLSLDSTKLAETAQADPLALSEFFLNSTNGFAAKLKTTVESYTDPANGKLTAAEDSVQTSVDDLDTRIARVQATVQARKDRLLLQFSNMEAILSKLQTQQTALSNLQNLNSSS